MRSTHVSFSETSSPALSSSSSSSSSESGTHSPTLSSSSGPDTSARMADIFARMEQVDDKPQHECGVFGIFGHPELNAAHVTFFALYALQHRGQESCGIATCDGKQIRVHKGMGLVSQVFDEDVTRPLIGRAGIGHVRYSTAGGSRLTNAQPFVLETDLGALAMAHNGQLTRQKDLRKRVLARGTGLFTNSDSEMIAQMLAMPRSISQAEVPFSPAKRKPSISSSSSSDNLKQQQQQQHSGTNGVTSGVANLTINLPPVTESGKTSNLPLTPNSLAVSNAAAHATSEGTGAALINQAVDGSVVDHRRTATAVPARTTGRISPPRHNSEADDPYLYQRFDDDPPAGKNMTEWDLRIAEFMRQSEGAYALAFLTPNAIYGCRDRLGLRPLCLGWQKHKDGTISHAIASESCAFGPIGFTYSREVLPGEIVRLDADGVHSTMALPKLQPTIKPSLCVFEYVYFARPDSLLEDQLVHSVRQKLGSQLAVECAAQADIVAGVPDSSIAAAIGYSLVSGLPFMEVLCKNRYIGRTFIQPDQTMRQNSIKLKYNPLSQNLRGKRIVLVDDSLVRGNTLKELIPLLKNAGALEVHVRISSPILRHPCYMGVDIGTYDEILATHLKTIEELNAFIGADSLAYLSHDGMMKAVLDGVSFHKKQTGQVGHCSACFTGEYPLSHDASDW